MPKKLLFTALLFGLLGPRGLFAQKTLLYLEIQAVGAYSTASDAVELFSLMPEDVMQKPSLGFDLLRRFSGRNRDIGLLAVQARLAYDQEGEHKLEPQLYNAYFRLKTKPFNVWAGHNRPALGLSSVLDSHGLLLPAPPMLGFGFDRDWGLGLERDFAWGGAAVSLTTGSGMPLHLKGNYLAAARVFNGVLARDNHSVGLSLAAGRILETMGYTLVDPMPQSWAAVALDATHVWRNVENRAELALEKRDGSVLARLFWRAGLSFLEEGRLKLEVQPALVASGEGLRSSLASGLTYLVSADLTGRLMVFADSRGVRFAVQLYYYKGL